MTIRKIKMEQRKRHLATYKTLLQKKTRTKKMTNR